MKKHRKFLAVLAVSMACMMFTACGDVQVKETQEQDNEITVEDSAKSEDISFAGMLPNHENFFANGKTTVIDSDGGSSYCISIKNVTKEEYNNFRDECKKGEFSKIRFEGESHFEARTESEEYYVSLQHYIKSETDDTQNSVNITCGVVKK